MAVGWIFGLQKPQLFSYASTFSMALLNDSWTHEM